MSKTKQKKRVVYQGVEGAYSHLAAKKFLPTHVPHGVPTFEHVVNNVSSGKAALGLLPIENSSAGRVADVHHLLPHSKLTVVAEHFLPIRHCLIGPTGGSMHDVRRVYSHPQALAQCSIFLKSLSLEAVPFGDTADAVRHISELQDPSAAAIGSAIAAKTYKNTHILRENIQNKLDNVTRFLVVQRAHRQEELTGNVMTSIYYTVRNVPAVLYKSLSGFATSGINILTLESFVPMNKTADASFYLEFEGTPYSPSGKIAMEELGYYCKNVDILGVYKKSSYRKALSPRAR
jgi:prephenate dehydratase